MDERTEKDNGIAPESITHNAGGIFGILPEKPSLEELAYQIKLGAELYAEVMIMMGDVIECLKSGGEERKQLYTELLNGYYQTALQGGYLQRKQGEIDVSLQEHFKSHSDKRSNKYKYSL